jgi:transcriptional regulator with XRE-family HTH domain
VRILEHHLVGDDRQRRKHLDEAFAEALIGQVIYRARTRAGLTQQELAELVGTTQSVISRLEDADYHGHSVAMLRRIAEALGQRLEIRFVPGKPRAA